MLAKFKKFSVMCMVIFLAGIFLSTLFPISGSASESKGMKKSGVKIVNPTDGLANINGQDTSFYHYRVKITADAETALILKQDSCMLLDRKGTKYSKCWLHLSGASAGTIFTQQAPIKLNTLAVELGGSGSSDVGHWNVSMVAGPDGAHKFKIPKGGFVVLNFLWEVPKGFIPGRIKIGDIINVSIRK